MRSAFVDSTIVVVVHVHGLMATVDYSCFGKRRFKMPHSHAGIIHVVVPPCIEYYVACVVIVFKVIYDNEVACSKAPDSSFPSLIGMTLIDPIDSPVVGCVESEGSRLKAINISIGKGNVRVTGQVGCAGVVHIVEFSAEVHLVCRSILARLPGKSRLGLNILLLISRIRIRGEFAVEQSCIVKVISYRANS